MEKKDFIVWASKMQHNYQPSDQVISRLANLDLIAIVGPTGTGKTTIIEKLGIPRVLSTVSRDKRPGEKNDVDYLFTEDYFKVIEQIKAGEFVQYLVSPNGEFYGTHIDSYPESGRCIMAIIAGAIPNFRSLGFRSITQIYIMPPSYIEWMRRIGTSRTKDLLTRISEARESLDLALSDDNYHYVLNDNIDNAVQDISLILSGKPINQHRTDLAMGTADLLLEHIGDGQELE
jgi:guanylate kinase